MEEVPSSPPLFCVLRNSPYLFPSRGVLPGGACKSRVTKDAPGTRDPGVFFEDPSNYGRSGGTYRGGHVETSRHYNPSKRGRFRGVSYSDGSYADLD